MDGILDSITRLLYLCIRLRLRFHLDKTLLFSSDIRLCGRIISANGRYYDLRNFAALNQMDILTTGDLQQCFCAWQCMRTEISYLSLLMSPLQEFLERFFTKAVIRSKRAVSRINFLATGWNYVQGRCFEACFDSLQHLLQMFLLDGAKRLCIFMDAIYVCWSDIATQVLSQATTWTPRSSI